MKSIDRKMFFGATPAIFENAKNLRNNMTPAEIRLWDYLKNWPLGFKFRRQHPAGSFILDFYCHRLKLVIEIDGGINKATVVKERDIERQKFLESEGLVFLRFTNDQVESQFEIVVSAIEQYMINNK